MRLKKRREGMLTTLREVMLATLISIPSQGHIATVTTVQMQSANRNKTAVPIVGLKALLIVRPY